MAPTRIVLLAALLASSLLAMPATAQAAPAKLTLEPPAKTLILVPGGPAQPVTIAWTYEGSEPAIAAGAAANMSTVVWDDPTCEAPGILVSSGYAQPMPVVDPAGRTSVRNGTATFQVRADFTAAGETEIACSAAAQASTGPSSTGAGAVTRFVVMVAFHGNITAKAMPSETSAGPQKQILLPVHVENHGNTRVHVNFELLDEPGGGWNPIAPNQILLESAAQGGTVTSKTVNLLVSTPYDNGYQSSNATLRLRITPASTLSNDVQGAPVEVTFRVSSSGWYIPGPGPAVLAAGLVALALLRRRSHA